MVKIHYTGQQGGAFGWGTFGTYIVKELRALGVYTDKDYEADVVFHVIANHDFDQAPGNRGPINFGMAFFESELGPRAVENAAKYDCLFVGSTWCKERCAERGITNTEVLIQGVDLEIFHRIYPRNVLWPDPDSTTGWTKPDGQFRIFSGGKFEYRKGQDLVIAAFREFAKTNPEAHLVCSWFNPWPKLIEQFMNQMGCAVSGVGLGNQGQAFNMLLHGQGLRADQFTILPKLSQQQLAAEMANTDCGLFPNRCEGGTNLVLMEYAACGGVVVANTDTGHADVKDLIAHRIHATTDEHGWAVQEVPHIVASLKAAHRYQSNRVIAKGSPPTWQDAAKQIHETATHLLSRAQSASR